MRDKVLVPGIPLMARVGCTADERRAPQAIQVDSELRCELSRAAEADSIEEAIDYVRVRDEAERVASKRPYALIEAIAERIASRLLEAFDAEEVLVRVRKPSALAGFGVPWAGVEVVRDRHG